MEAIELRIPAGDKVALKATLKMPFASTSLVIFSHGSGSSRLSPRNRFVAEVLNHERIGTLLTDLLTEEEDLNYDNRFNIDLIAGRLISITNYVSQLPQTRDLNIGYFGASTGTASALDASAMLGNTIKAVVSRGGRPDLSKSIAEVTSPCLFLVGSLDRQVIELNKKAFESLTCEKKMKIVTDASHLFEEPGKLKEVATLATDWFLKYLCQPTSQLSL